MAKDTVLKLDPKSFGLSDFNVTAVGSDRLEYVIRTPSQWGWKKIISGPGQSMSVQVGQVRTWVTLISTDKKSAVIALGHATPPSAKPPPFFETITKDPADCLDGVCTIRVSKGTVFSLQTYGLEGFQVADLRAGKIDCVLWAVNGAAFRIRLNKPGQSASGGFEIKKNVMALTWVTLISQDKKSAVLALSQVEPP